MTLGRAAINELLDRHDLSPRRALGQNFLADGNTVRRIVSLAEIGEGDRVVEIGPGLGSLTLALTDAGAVVTAVETDEGLLAPLAEVLDGRAVEVVHADATRFGDWVPRLEGVPHTLVANLPYNVGTRLVADVLDHVPEIERLVVMVQAEVGDRMMAEPGTKDYGALSVKVASWATARRLCKVPPSVFVPQPNVDSVVMDLRRHPEPVVPDDVDRRRLFALVRSGFGQRRKMLRRSLAGEVDAAAFVAAGVAADARAETLDLAAWIRLTRAAASPATVADEVGS